MASPLNWFRRNAIWIMVPVGIFCMAFFGLGAVFDTLTSTARSGTRENPTVASYNGGEFTRDTISGMVFNHYRTRNFLNELRNLGIEKRGDDFVELVRPIAPLQGEQQEYIDEQIIGRFLMAEKAEAEGLAVSESMIDQYLFATYGVLDSDGLSNRDLELLNREVNNGQISMAAIRRHLRLELLNQQMVTLSYSGIPRVPSPLESVQYYAKVNQKVDCEIFPVSISEYVDQSATPSQSEIRDLYEKGKFEFKDPSGKRPGFKMSRRVKLQYFVGDYQDFLDKASEGLSDEEIQAKYDELVAQESDLVMEIVADEEDDMPAINLEGGDDSEEEAAPVPGASSDEAADKDQSYNVRPSDSKFVLVSMPAQDGEAVVGEVVEGAVETPAAGAVEIVADQVEGAVEIVTEGAEAVAEGAEVVTEGVQIVTEPAQVATEPGVVVTGEETAEPIKLDTPVVTETKEATGSATKEATTESMPAVKSTDVGGIDDMKDVGGIGDMEDADVGPLLTDDDKIVKRAKPLDEVADAIRRQLKGKEASDAMDIAIKTAESEIENYFTQRLQWEVSGKERNKPAPELPNFQDIADRNGLRLASTELVDNEGLKDTELGGVYEIIRIQNRTVPVPLADLIFDKFNELTEYSTAKTNNRFTNKSYVYWPTELGPTEVPKLEDCKDQIIDYWRQQKAIEAATEAANGIAAKVSKNKKLSEIDPAKTIPTGEFTWFQPRGRRAVLSTPIGVDSPSEAFMETAFSLSQGEAGTAVNGSGDTIFVIQAQSQKVPISEIGDDFLKNQLFRFQRLPPDVGLVSDHYFRQKTLDWNREYVDSMGFELMK